MTDSYKVGYSVDALDDLREIYSYIANELLVPETATAQLGRIRKEVRSLDFMPDIDLQAAGAKVTTYYKDEKDGHVYGFMPSWRKDLPKETE